MTHVQDSTRVSELMCLQESAAGRELSSIGGPEGAQKQGAVQQLMLKTSAETQPERS